MSSFIAPIVSILAGGAIATATVVGVISSQTAEPDTSPANVEAPFIDYGTSAE